MEQLAFPQHAIMTSWHSHAENEASRSSRDPRNGLSSRTRCRRRKIVGVKLFREWRFWTDFTGDCPIKSGIWPSMAAAAELILRSPVGAEPAVFRWPPAVPVCLCGVSFAYGVGGSTIGVHA